MNFRNLREMALLAKDLPRMKRMIGSSHDLYTDTYKDTRLVIKFPDKYLYVELADINDPDLHILSEYLAYQVYDLYGINIPNFVDFVINDDDTLGLATQFVAGGRRATEKNLNDSNFAITFLVHAFIANWDVFGGFVDEYANIMYDTQKKKYVVIDPGGSLSFRARGKRKGPDFSSEVGELDTMAVYDIFRGEEVLRKSIVKFKSVSWSKIESHLNMVHEKIIADLEFNMYSEYKKEMLINSWKDMYKEVITTLKRRYQYILNNV